MGKYDDISPDRLRGDLVAFARLILRLDRENGLLDSVADLQRLLGDLRQKLFAYEIRSANSRLESGRKDEDGADPESPPTEEERILRQSLKVVREAMQRREEMLEEWEGGPPGEEDED